MMWWLRRSVTGEVYLHRDEENHLVQDVRAGKYLKEIDILLEDGVVKTLSLETYKTEGGAPKPTKRRGFVETWGQNLPSLDWPDQEMQSSQNSDDSATTSADEHNTENIPPVIAGSHEIFLEENYRGE
ncbi:uncharacterized protein LOC132745915 [Ruditapes philippinarum]|uniref:uncharacterized protein LOC132745915 n=1 Tax=Ruditapes philippinarum TaxID=129788 RepID=UPI00295A68C9|nr:uncharacterized protein LOC132745915 [Ruditapes philippinarum]